MYSTVLSVIWHEKKFILCMEIPWNPRLILNINRVVGRSQNRSSNSARCFNSFGRSHLNNKICTLITKKITGKCLEKPKTNVPLHDPVILVGLDSYRLEFFSLAVREADGLMRGPFKPWMLRGFSGGGGA